MKNLGKIVVVGAGFSGAVIARKIAEELDLKVDVIERRNQLGGNAYDEFDDHGILIQKYGPHYLNTNKYFIIKYLARFAELFPHNAKLLSVIDGEYIRLPFNFESMQQLIGPESAAPIMEILRRDYYGKDRVPILDLVNHPNEHVSGFGSLLFEKSFRNYTSKMWGIGVDEVEPYVLERSPFALNYDERYLNKDFQYLPVQGFTELFRNMLNHPNIKVTLNCDALDHIAFDSNNHIVTYDGESVIVLVYTGAVDEFFGYRYGYLPYRSLNIKYEYSNKDSVLPSEVISYPQADGYTRKTEYRKLMRDDSKIHGSVVATEYPLWYDAGAECGNTPYYPVVTDKSKKIYEKYYAEAEKYGNIYLCGRLAEFKYYNMDVCIEHAFEKFEQIKGHLERA